jgi:uncharacterized membrane protein (UPF0136 family)
MLFILTSIVGGVTGYLIEGTFLSVVLGAVIANVYAILIATGSTLTITRAIAKDKS